MTRTAVAADEPDRRPDRWPAAEPPATLPPVPVSRTPATVARWLRLDIDARLSPN